MPELKTMSVAELRWALEQYDQDTPVCLAVPSRDHRGTVLAAPIHQMDQRPVAYSDSHQHFALPRRHQDHDEAEETTEVLVLGLAHDG